MRSGRRRRIGIELCWNHNFQGVHTDELGVEVSLLSTTRMDTIIAIACTSLGALTGDSIALDATFGRFQSMIVTRLGPSLSATAAAQRHQ